MNSHTQPFFFIVPSFSHSLSVYLVLYTSTPRWVREILSDSETSYILVSWHENFECKDRNLEAKSDFSNGLMHFPGSSACRYLLSLSQQYSSSKHWNWSPFYYYVIFSIFCRVWKNWSKSSPRQLGYWLLLFLGILILWFIILICIWICCRMSCSPAMKVKTFVKPQSAPRRIEVTNPILEPYVGCWAFYLSPLPLYCSYMNCFGLQVDIFNQV